MMDEALEYKIHPAAQFLPAASESEVAELAKDIKRNGLLESVELHGGMVIDGRKRLAACQLVGVRPRFVDRNGIVSPIFYAVHKNIERFNFSKTRRAVIAAKMVPELKTEIMEARRWGKLVVGGDELKGPFTGIAARAVGCAPYYVRLARQIQRSNLEMFEDLWRGRIEISRIVHGKLAKLPPSILVEQRDATARRRLVVTLSQLHGLCRTLAKLDVARAMQSADDSEREGWRTLVRDCARDFRLFQNKHNSCKGAKP